MNSDKPSSESTARGALGKSSVSPIRFLADGASAPSLFNRVPLGTLVKFVETSGWQTSARRQYAVSAATTVEQFRLKRRVLRDDTFGDQAVAWGSTEAAPKQVRRAALKLQALAVQELSELAVHLS